MNNLLSETTNRKYAHLMIDYNTPDFIKEFQSKIKEDELYREKGNDDYGLQTVSHVTLVPCLDNDVNLEDIKKYLKKLKRYGIVLTDISKFECEKYDVLKCAATSQQLFDANSELLKHFKNHSEFKEYRPHLTIAYMKHGMADKYLAKMLPKLIYLEPKKLSFFIYR